MGEFEQQLPRLKCLSYEEMLFEDVGHFPPRFLVKVDSFKKNIDFYEQAKICIETATILPLQDGVLLPEIDEKLEEAVSRSISDSEFATSTEKKLRVVEQLRGHSVSLHFDENRELVVRLGEAVFVFKDLMFDKEDSSKLISWNIEKRNEGNLPEDFSKLSRVILETLLEQTSLQHEES